MDNQAISVLLVEDNPADARLVRELLGEVGGKIRLRHADRLAAAMEQMGRESTDLVLLDLTLPDSAGLSSITRILADAPDLPIVVLTGMADEEMANQAIHLGAQDYLVKGNIEGYRLAQVIRYALERKKNEQQLHQLKQQYEAILTSVSEGVCVTDQAGMVTYANPSACRMLGWKHEEMLGRHLHPLIHGEKPDGAHYPEEDCPYRYGSAQHQVEDVFWSKERIALPVEVDSAAIYENGAAVGAVLTFRDIAARLQAESSLRHTQQKLLEREYFLQRVMDNIPQHIFWKDRDSLFQGCNRIAALAVGLTNPDEIVGKNDGDLHRDPATAQHLRAQDARVMGSGQPEYHQITQYLRNDGSPAWLDVNKIPLQDNQGQVSGLLITYEDITERKRAESALNQLNETLEQRVGDAVEKKREAEYLLIQQSRHAAMGEMIGNIAHQWRQPLNALAILLANIRLDYQDGGLTGEAMERYAQTGNRLVQKMSGTIDDFRNFFRPRKQAEQFSLLQALRDTLWLLEASFRNSNIQVLQEGHGDMLLWGYSNEFGQVLLNILANAKDAFQERGSAAPRIDIAYSSDASQAFITIRDNAGGIPDEVSVRIFDPYYTTKEGGTGIGLYMSKTIIENNMKGQILFRNAGGGAEFTIVVPLAGEAKL